MMKRIWGVLLIIALLCPNTVFAIDKRVFSDIENHWASEVIEVWYAQDLVKGYPDGSFKPDNSVTRAEFISMVNNIYGYSYKTTQYMDIDVRDWYYSAATIAKSNGYMDWHNSPYFYGNQAITREEVCAILYRVIQLEKTDSDKVLSFFTDEFNDWSKDYIASLVVAGYLSGYPDKSFRASNTITRAESVVMLNQVMGTIYDTEGSYDGEYTLKHPKNVTITSSDVHLSNMVIVGDLILAAGIGNGDVELTNITVLGRTIVNGGGLSTITITNCNLGPMIVLKYGDSIRILSEDSYIESIEQLSQLHLEGDFKETIIRVASNDRLILDGNFKKLIVDERATIELSPETVVDKAVINADASITGEGKLAEVELNNDEAIIKVTVDKYTNILVVIEDEETPQGAVAPPTSTPPSSGGTPPTGGTTPTPTPTNKAPVLTSNPSIVGALITGSTIGLEGYNFTDETQNLTYTFKWELKELINGPIIKSSPLATYTVVEEDEGNYIRGVVSAQDQEGLLTSAQTPWQLINLTNLAPLLESDPVISGIYKEGATLSVSPGTWSDENVGTLTFTYSWFISTSDSGDGTKVSSTNSYIINESDVGKYIKAVVTASDDKGLFTASTPVYNKILSKDNEAPVLDGDPEITGNYKDGTSLVVSDGSWIDEDVGSLVFSYRWLLSDTNSGVGEVVGTTNTYNIITAVVGKYIKAEVTAMDNGDLSGLTTTSYVEILSKDNVAPVLDGDPEITGNYKDGTSLVVSDGSWIDEDVGSLVFSYRWLLSDTNSGVGEVVGTTNTYNIITLVVGKYIKAEVTATDDKGLSAITTLGYVEILSKNNVAPSLDDDPEITGNYKDGTSLIVSDGSWIDEDVGSLVISYRWLLSDTTSGVGEVVGTTNTYDIITAVVGKYIKAEVTATDNGDLSSLTTTSYVEILPKDNEAPVLDDDPEITGNYKDGTSLSVSDGSWIDEDVGSLVFSYRWLLSNTSSGVGEVVGTTNTYDIITPVVGKYIKAEVTATDNGDLSSLTTTSYVEILPKDNDAPSLIDPPDIIGSINELETITAFLGNWEDDQVADLSFSYYWEVNDEPNEDSIMDTLHDDDYDIPRLLDSRYVRLTVTSEDEEGLKTIANTNWIVIEWNLDYVSLGDSISKGYVFPPAIEDHDETPYTEYLATDFGTIYPGSTVDSYQHSFEGDEVSHLLNKLTVGNPDYDLNLVSDVENADIITVCIGGNNIMKAAKYYVGSIIFVGDIYGYDFDNVNESIADGGMSDFEIDFPLLVAKLKELNSDSKIVFMTIYNPYNKGHLGSTENEIDIDMHDFADGYLSDMNTIIRNNSIGNYEVADVYTRMIDYTTDETMGDYTYMYFTELYSVPLLNVDIKLANPHPKEAGQLEIYYTHLELFD